MPSLVSKTFSSYFKNLLGINQASNTGVDATTRTVQDGAGNNTAISLSDDVLSVQAQNDDSVGTLLCKTKSGSTILTVDTTNSKVLMGASQVPATLFKEMGLFDFSPTAGYHNPLIANNMMQSDSGEDIIADDSMFSNGTDPATTLDISADGTPMIAVACYWVLDNDITLDSVRYAVTTDGADSILFHIMSYDIETSSNKGDLSEGIVNAHHVSAISSTATSVATGTLTLPYPDIDANKVVIGFVESDSTTDVTCSLNIKYHIR